jgi:hypothetical protein
MAKRSVDDVKVPTEDSLAKNEQTNVAYFFFIINLQDTQEEGIAKKIKEDTDAKSNEGKEEEEESTDSKDKRGGGKKKKCVIIFGYCGLGYQGLQKYAILKLGI